MAELLISADCHAGPLPDEARGYVDPGFRDAYDDWLADVATQQRRRAEHTGAAIYGDEAIEDFAADTAEASPTGMAGAHDSAVRLDELDADGVWAEVVFPGGSIDTVSPFGAGLMTYQYDEDPTVWLAGARAYNRWLADFCALVPGRRGGVGLVTLDDIDVAVAEVRWLSDHGVFGGILLPSGTGDNPAYNHPRYEPLWAVCEEESMPVHTHSGWTPNYGDFPGSLGIFLTEISWWAHRAFWMLAWSGAFERHPGLTLVMTEQGSGWVPDTLAQLDDFYGQPMFRHLRRQLPLAPSEYFRRQCYVGASFVRPDEVAARHAIGVDKLLWGSDYPHIEGTWPHTAERLAEAFAGVPDDEVAAMCRDNAAGVYGFVAPA